MTETVKTTVEVTDEMVAAGLAQYAEGGCMGLDENERREVVRAIIEAAVAKIGKKKP